MKLGPLIILDRCLQNHLSQFTALIETWSVRTWWMRPLFKQARKGLLIVYIKCLTNNTGNIWQLASLLRQPIPVSRVRYGDMAWSHYPALSARPCVSQFGLIWLCHAMWPSRAAFYRNLIICLHVVGDTRHHVCCPHQCEERNIDSFG